MCDLWLHVYHRLIQKSNGRHAAVMRAEFASACGAMHTHLSEGGACQDRLVHIHLNAALRSSLSPGLFAQ